MSLPAGAMISLVIALEGRLRSGRVRSAREVAAVDFVTGNHSNVLRAGELLRQNSLAGFSTPEAGPPFRQASLTSSAAPQRC